jgi:hypothetical protein
VCPTSPRHGKASADKFLPKVPAVKFDTHKEPPVSIGQPTIATKNLDSACSRYGSPHMGSRFGAACPLGRTFSPSTRLRGINRRNPVARFAHRKRIAIHSAHALQLERKCLRTGQQGRDRQSGNGTHSGERDEGAFHPPCHQRSKGKKV